MVSSANRRRGLVALVLLLVAASRTAAATQQSFPDDDERRLLAPGMVALFASPVLRVRLADYVVPATPDQPAAEAAEALRRRLYESILQLWREYLEVRPKGGDDDDEEEAHELSDEFFRYQQERGRPHLGFAGETGERIVAALTLAVGDYLERVRRVDFAYASRVRPQLQAEEEEPSSDGPRQQAHETVPVSAEHMEVWASVHDGCNSVHPTHVHPGATLSGVLHVRVPRAAGRLIFKDPRGFLPPFDLSSIRHTPVEGEVVLFPPWLPHAVAPARGDCRSPQHGRPREPRVSLSFNYHGVPYAPAELDEFEDVRLVQAEATSSFHVPDVEKPATLEDVGQGKARHGKAKGFARQGMAIVCVSGPCDD